MQINELLAKDNAVNLTAYHGSNAKFPSFDQNKSRIINDFYGGGVAYFTDNLEVAKTYAKSMFRSKGGDMYVYKVNLSLDKIFDVDDVFSKDRLTQFFNDKTIQDFARGAGLFRLGESLNEDAYAILSKLSLGNMSLSGDQVFKGLSSGMNQTAKARQVLINLGYDGLRYNGGLNMNMTTRHNVYLAYYADDIKIQNIYRLAQKVPAHAA